MLWLLRNDLDNWRLLLGQRVTTTVKRRRHIHVSWDDASVHELKHTVLHVVSVDGWRITERVVSHLLGQDAFGSVGSVAANSTYAQFFKFDVGNASLSTSILEVVGSRQRILSSQESVSVSIFRITDECISLLFLVQKRLRLCQGCNSLHWSRLKWDLLLSLFSLRRLMYHLVVKPSIVD